MARKRTTAFAGTVNPKSNYVFYTHLLTNPSYSGLAQQVETNYANAFAQTPNTPDMSIIEKLETMAKTERQKEIAFIKFTFGVDINCEIDAENSKEFIDAFNTYMQLQNVYEARKTLIMHGYGEEEFTQSLKDAYSYYPSYFARIFEDNVKSISEQIVALKDSGKTFQEALDQVLKKEIPGIIDATTDKLAIAKGNAGLSDSKKEEVQTALREINKAINLFGKSNFGRMVYSALNLDKIQSDTEMMIQELSKRNSNLVSQEAIEAALRKSVEYHKSNQGVHALGGSMSEVIASISVSALFNNLKTGRHGKVFWTGKTGMAADNIMVVAKGNISVETEQINKVLDKGKRTSRQSNIETVREIENILERGNDEGFIVYSSDKNYLQVRKRSSGGFYESAYGAGGAQNLRLFEPILAEATQSGKRASVLLQGIMQTLKGKKVGSGAIGENDKTLMEQKLAQYFAYFLFDDLEFLNQDKIETSNYKRVHLMNLNGIYVPLSTLMNLYAKALRNEFSEAKMRPTSFVKVSISAPAIKYDYDNDSEVKPENAWAIQRNEALENTTVHLAFLKSLRDVLNGLTP